MSITLAGNFERFPLNTLQSSEKFENHKYYALTLSAIWRINVAYILLLFHASIFYSCFSVVGAVKLRAQLVFHSVGYWLCL